MFSTNVNSLAVISQPVAEVDTLDIHLGELLAGSAGHEQGKEGILNVAVKGIRSQLR